MRIMARYPERSCSVLKESKRKSQETKTEGTAEGVLRSGAANARRDRIAILCTGIP